MARTTHRSSAGTKLYAVRDAEGQFKDIQNFQKAHGQDVQRDSMAEKMADKKVAAKKKAPAKKKMAMKAAPMKAAPKKAVAKKKAARKK